MKNHQNNRFKKSPNIDIKTKIKKIVLISPKKSANNEKINNKRIYIIFNFKFADFMMSFLIWGDFMRFLMIIINRSNIQKKKHPSNNRN